MDILSLFLRKNLVIADVAVWNLLSEHLLAFILVLPNKHVDTEGGE